jgi:hypothetical protein
MPKAPPVPRWRRLVSALTVLVLGRFATALRPLPNQQDGSDAGEANDRAQEMDAEHQDAIQYHRSIPWILVNEIPNR